MVLLKPLRRLWIWCNMAIKNISELKHERPRIDLTGPDGNAFILLGLMGKWGKQLGKDTKALSLEMMEGDYENLLAVMERDFGAYVDFYR